MKISLTKSLTLAALSLAGPVLVPAQASAADKKAHAPEVDLATMVELDEGTFTMGTSTDEEVGRYGDSWFVNEQPDHQVSVDGFYLDTFEVTVSEFALFLTYAAGDYHWHPDQPIEKVDGGYLAAKGAENEPARLVTWQAADHYCKWAGKRLPTEAEWEYAAAGADNREFPWGDNGGGCEVANYFAGSSFCEEGVLEVGSHADGQTPEGIFNMGGNVAEWVADWYDTYPEDGAAQTNPTGPETGTLRVVRGAGHLSSGRWRRSKARWGAEPKRRSQNIGFRCAIDAGSADAGSGDDLAIRGELGAPADENRQTSDRPLAPAAETPAVVAENLLDPGAVVAVTGVWYVLDRGAGSIVSIDPADWTMSSVYDGLDQPAEMVSDGVSLFVTDTGTGEILQIDPSDGTSTVLAADQVEPHALDANDQQVAWLSETTLRRYDVTGAAVEDVLTDLVDPVTLVLDEGLIFYSTRGNSDETKISFIDPSAAEGVQVLIDKESIGLGDNMELFYSQHVFVDAAGWLWFDLRYRGFPNNALVMCRINLQDGSGSCPTFTPPPHDTRMTVVGKTAYLPVRNTIIRYTYDEDPTFYEITPWTRAGGVLASEEFVVWTDEQNGRVYYQEVL